MPSEKDRQSLADLLFIEHALRSRTAMLTPRHQDKLRGSKTMETLRHKVDDAKSHAPSSHREALCEMLTALERRISKLERREGRVSMSFLSAAPMQRWSEETEISSVA